MLYILYHTATAKDYLVQSKGQISTHTLEKSGLNFKHGEISFGKACV